MEMFDSKFKEIGKIKAVETADKEQNCAKIRQFWK